MHRVGDDHILVGLGHHVLQEGGEPSGRAASVAGGRQVRPPSVERLTVTPLASMLVGVANGRAENKTQPGHPDCGGTGFYRRAGPTETPSPKPCGGGRRNVRSDIELRLTQRDWE